MAKAALDIYPESMTISTNLASVLMSAGRLEESIAVSRQAIAHRVADYATHNNLGAALLRLGDRTGYSPGQLDEAIAELRIATALNPDLEDAFVNLALALLNSGQPDVAIAECHAALAINSRSDRALYGMGTILMSLGKPAEARKFIEHALAQNPDSAEAHYAYGLILSAQNEVPDAATHFEAALRIDPHLAEAQYELAGAFARSGDWRAAATCYAAAIDGVSATLSAWAWNNLGVVDESRWRD